MALHLPAPPTSVVSLLRAQATLEVSPPRAQARLMAAPSRAPVPARFCLRRAQGHLESPSLRARAQQEVVEFLLRALSHRESCPPRRAAAQPRLAQLVSVAPRSRLSWFSAPVSRSPSTSSPSSGPLVTRRCPTSHRHLGCCTTPTSHRSSARSRSTSPWDRSSSP